MKEKTRIQIGDKVDVHFQGTCAMVIGTVLEMAHQTGECWIIKDLFGDLHYVQSFSSIVYHQPK